METVELLILNKLFITIYYLVESGNKKGIGKMGRISEVKDLFLDDIINELKNEIEIFKPTSSDKFIRGYKYGLELAIYLIENKKENNNESKINT